MDRMDASRRSDDDAPVQVATEMRGCVTFRVKVSAAIEAMRSQCRSTSSGDDRRHERDLRGAKALSLLVRKPSSRPSWRSAVQVAEVDSASCHVVGRYLEVHAVARDDPDTALPHLPPGVSEHVGAVGETYPELRVGQHLLNSAFHLDKRFFGHRLSFSVDHAHKRESPVSRAFQPSAPNGAEMMLTAP